MPALWFGMKTNRLRQLDDGQFPIDEAARELGLNSFTLYGLIRRHQAKIDAMPWGEVVLRRHEIERLMGHSPGNPQQ